MIVVRVTSWQPGFDKVGVNRALRSSAGFGLAEAKSAVDRTLDGESVVVEFADADSAERFAEAAERLRVVCELRIETSADREAS